MSTFAKLAQEPPKLKREPIDIPEWGPAGTFVLVELDGPLMQEVVNEFHDLNAEKEQVKAAALLLSKCLYDEEGNRPSVEDLLKQSGGVLMRVSLEAQRINGLGKAAEEQLEKN